LAVRGVTLRVVEARSAVRNLIRKEVGLKVGEVSRHISIDDVIDGAAAYRTEKCDGVIAFGGGSALDVGKASATVSVIPTMKPPSARAMGHAIRVLFTFMLISPLPVFRKRSGRA
jgi:alcohol dehydrogenase class IV